MIVRVVLETMLDVPAGQDVQHAVDQYFFTNRHASAGSLLRFMKIMDVSVPESWQTGHEWEGSVWTDPDE